jgi:hypothetical protein
MVDREMWVSKAWTVNFANVAMVGTNFTSSGMQSSGKTAIRFRPVLSPDVCGILLMKQGKPELPTSGPPSATPGSARTASPLVD